MITIRLRQQIRAYQERTGERLTYAELARRTGLARATVETLASRTSYNTTLATVDKLCQALGCGIADLLDYSPDEAS
ncbi:MAG: helix-turn-helix transcriptional regulator [Planctomycetaceae bacterium]|nr:helix-turn-helix transcriptional regulator [Planctomycetaceae bacterium]